MKQQITTHNSFIWGVAAIILGGILVVWPENVIVWLIYFVAALALLGAIVQFSAFLITTKGDEGRWKHLPFTAPIAFIWGILLLVNPEMWAGMFMVVFGLLIIFLSINQIFTLVRMRRSGVTVRWGYFIFPSLFLLSGFAVFTKPISSAQWIMVFIGAWIIAYGITEMFSYFSLNKNKQLEE